MKKAWSILLISAITDFFICAGTSWIAVTSSGQPITNTVIVTVLVGGIIQAARTIQQALKATPETSAALTGDTSIVQTTTTARTP